MEEIVFQWGGKYQEVFGEMGKGGSGRLSIRTEIRNPVKKRNFKEFSLVGAQDIY